MWERYMKKYSHITIEWHSVDAIPGTYRIRHYGDRKDKESLKVLPYEGVTRTFQITE